MKKFLFITVLIGLNAFSQGSTFEECGEDRGELTSELKAFMEKHSMNSATDLCSDLVGEEFCAGANIGRTDSVIDILKSSLQTSLW